MLTTKIVIRIMNEQEEILGWAEVMAEARGDGKLWVAEPTMVLIEKDGVTRYFSSHWCDVNVELRHVVEPKQVKFGEMLEIPGELAIITVGPAAGGLPSVTVREPIRIGIPVGNLGAKGREFGG
jgi:hypothetical protein